MNKELREAMLAQIEARQQVNALAPDATEEARAAAVAALNDADQKVADLLTKETVEAPRDLREQISLGVYLRAAAEEKVLTEGPEAELRQELGLSDSTIPIDALAPVDMPGEARADVVSPQDSKSAALPYGTVNVNTGPLLRRIFLRTDSAFLRVGMPMVPPGLRRYPVMTAGTSAGMVARGAQRDAGAAKFDVVDVSPQRLTARYVFDLEGQAELSGLEAILRSDLRMAMGWQLDTEILLGDGQNNRVTGLLAQLDLTKPPGVAAGKEGVVPTWPLAKQMGYGALDGLHARMESDLRMLIGRETYEHLRTLYRDGGNDNSDGIDVLRMQGVPLSESFQIPDPAIVTYKGENAKSTKKVQSLLVNMEPAAAVAPVWQGITIIRDPYTNAGKGQVVLTANMLFGMTMRRKDGWRKWGIRTEA